MAKNPSRPKQRQTRSRGARVYAYDGSEFTAGQALWLKGQLREIRKACAQNNPADAAERLKAVQDLVAGHPWRTP